MKKLMYAILSRIAPVLCLVFITSPFIPTYLQKKFGVDVMANYVWTLTAVSILVLGHCLKSFDYWHAEERGRIGKVYYHSALILSSATAVIIGIGLLKGLLGSGYDLFALFSNSSVLLLFQALTLVLIGLQFVIPKFSNEQATRFVLWYKATFNG